MSKSERDIDAELLALIEADVLRPAIFIFADFPSGARRVWTGIGSITFQGETWEGLGTIMSLESIPESVDSGAQGINVRLNGLDQDILDILVNDDYQGRDVVLYLSFWDAIRSTLYEPPPPPAIPPLPGTLQAETTTWIAAAGAAGGGTISDDSKAIADKLVVLLKAESFYSKIKYLIPHLGPDLITSITPLINTGTWAQPTNFGFVDADYSEARGLQGSGTSANKYINLNFGPSDIGLSFNGGFGIWALWINQYTYINVLWPSPISSTTSEGGGSARHIHLDLVDGLQEFQWAKASTAAFQTDKAIPGHWYGQRETINLRKIFLDGVRFNANNTSAGTADASDFPDFSYMAGMGNDGPRTRQPWPGRSGLAYWTDGQMTDAEETAFHDIVEENLIKMVGRVTDPLDPLWAGFLDTDTFKHSGNGRNEVTFMLEHRLVDILRTRGWRYTYRDQLSLNSGTLDTGLSRMGQIQDVTISWGRDEQ